jgi:hypothetical protein
MSTLWDSLPEELRTDLADQRASEWGFGAGPSCVIRKTERCEPAIPARHAVAQLERYRSVFKRAHVLLGDRRVLFFGPSGFCHLQEGGAPPQPGLTVRHPK